MKTQFVSKVSDGVPEIAITLHEAVAINHLESIGDLMAVGYVLVDQPDYPYDGKRYKPGVPVKINDAYVGVWEEQEIPEHETSAQKLAWKTVRNRLLQSTDWTQAADAPVDREAWAAYRQALRDVPNQVGFPWKIEWPEKP
jgi:hypothetical protein